MDKKQIILDLLESLIREMESAEIQPLMEEKKPMVVVKEEKVDAMPLEGNEEALKDKIAGALEKGVGEEPVEDEEEDRIKKLRERLS